MSVSSEQDAPDSDIDQFEDSRDDFDDYLESEHVLNTSFESNASDGLATKELANKTVNLLLHTPTSMEPPPLDSGCREEPTDMDEDADAWDTPADTPENLFMTGTKPSKQDVDVLKALESGEVNSVVWNKFLH